MDLGSTIGIGVQWEAGLCHSMTGVEIPAGRKNGEAEAFQFEILSESIGMLFGNKCSHDDNNR